MQKRSRVFIQGLHLFFLMCCLSASAQEQNRPTISRHIFDLGSEIQVYPGGYIPGVRIESSLGDKYTLGARGGYNVVRHRDLGKNDDERGGGFGFSAGIKRYFKNDFRAWHLGLRTDIWFNAIDWKNDVGLPNETAGNTDVLVVQPTVELGYAFLLNQFIVSPAISFGWEFNAKTRGRETGEGPILLAGVTCALRI